MGAGRRRHVPLAVPPAPSTHLASRLPLSQVAQASHAPRDPRSRAKALNGRLMAAHTPQVGQRHRVSGVCASLPRTLAPLLLPARPTAQRLHPFHLFSTTQEILGIVEAHLGEMDSINTTAALQRLARVRERPAGSRHL